MFERFINIFNIPDLRKRLLITLGLLALFRVGAHIPTPGINITALTEFFAEHSRGILGFIDMFAGGALRRFSVFALGVMPYISASIILQLLTTAIPYLEKLSKEGELGRRKIIQYARYLTVLISIIQSYGTSLMLRGAKSPISGASVVIEPGLGFTLITIITVTSGTIFLMWLGEQITEFGIGNGISLLIFAGIVAELPRGMFDVAQKASIGEFNPVFVLILIVIFCSIVAFVILTEQAQRRLPIQYAQKIVGRKIYTRPDTHLPLKLNPSGVIPIIFAAAVVLLPAQIAQWLGHKYPFFNTIASFLAPDTLLYLILYGILIVFFVYFYTFVQFNPNEIAENLRKFGGFVPGIRPGENTSTYLSYILRRIILSGSIILALIAIIPSILESWLKVPGTMAHLMGGTSLLIIIGVALDTIKQIEAHLLMHHYDGFLKKGKLRGRWI